jgi:hypothetical protein
MITFTYAYKKLTSLEKDPTKEREFNYLKMVFLNISAKRLMNMQRHNMMMTAIMTSLFLRWKVRFLNISNI